MLPEFVCEISAGRVPRTGMQLREHWPLFLSLPLSLYPLIPHPERSAWSFTPVIFLIIDLRFPILYSPLPCFQPTDGRSDLSTNENLGGENVPSNCITRINTTFQHICENALGREDNTRKGWISDNTWQMTERRKQTKGKLRATNARTRKGRELEKQYAALSKEIKKSARRQSKIYINLLAPELFSAHPV